MASSSKVPDISCSVLLHLCGCLAQTRQLLDYILNQHKSVDKTHTGLNAARTGPDQCTHLLPRTLITDQGAQHNPS
jgi:hypothetical protein